METAVVVLPADIELATEKISEVILAIVNDYKNEMPPKCTFDNDGIGHYEYWGAPGFDKGTDYLLIEGNEDGPLKLEFDITEPAKDPGFAKLLDDTLCDTRGDSLVCHTIYDYDGNEVGLEEEMVISYAKKTITNERLSLELEWEVHHGAVSSRYYIGKK